MTRRRFYVPRDSIQNSVATFPPGQAHHLRDVLRMGTGDVVEIFDGSGSGYLGEVELKGSEVLVRGLKSISSLESPFRLILAAALIKSAKFELVLQKATELGVSEIIPLRTRLAEVRIPDDRIESRYERWRRILLDAARQCGRSDAPALRKPLDFTAFLSAEDLSPCTKILFYEKAMEPFEPDSLVTDQIILCIGPEGGWDQGEIQKARDAGCRILGLGPWILRAETAAIAGLSIVQHQINLIKLGRQVP